MEAKGFSFRPLCITRRKRPGPASWLLLVFGLYCLVLGVIAPHFARPFLEHALSEEFGVHCPVGKLRVNPLTWKIIAKNVSVPYPHLPPGAALPPMPEEDFIHLERLEFFIKPSSLVKQTLIVNELRLVKPRIAITRHKDGSLSPQYLFPDGGESGNDSGVSLFPLIVRNITMRDGILLFTDEPGGATYTIRHINAALPFASTLDSDKETPLTPSITALVNGQTLTINGETRPFAKTRQTVFTLKTRDLSLPELRGYIAPYTNLTLEKGRLHTTLTLRLDIDASDVLHLALAGTVEIADLALSGPEGSVFETKHAMADMENVLLGPRRVTINSISLENPKAVFRRGKNGELDWPSFFGMPDAAPAKELPAQLIIGKASVTGGTAEWHDTAMQSPVRYVAENIEAAFSDVSTEGQGKADFTLSFGKGKEEAALRGRATIAPLRADAAVTLQNIPLAPFSPYITEDNGVTLHGGLIEASGDISFRLSPENNIVISGASAVVSGVQVKDARHPATPFFDVGKIGISGTSLDLAAKTLRINSVNGTGVAANIVRGKNGALILPEAQSAAGSKQSPTPSKQSAAGSAIAEKPWDVAVSSLHLAKSTLSFVDASLRKTAVTPLANITITGKNFATAGKKEWSATIAGKPGERGELNITAKGTLAPLNLTFAGKMDKADIRPLSPYLQENTRLSLAEATLGGDFKGTLKRVAKSKRGADCTVNGNLGLYGVSLLYEQREIAGWGRLRAENIAFRAPSSGGRSLAATSVVMNTPRLFVSIDENGINSITKALQPPANVSGDHAANASHGSNASSPFLNALSIGNVAIKRGEAVYQDLRVAPPYALQVNTVDVSLKNLSLDPRKSSPFTAAMYVNGSPVTAGGTLSSLFDSPSGKGNISIRSLDLARFTQYAVKYLGYPVQRGELTADITAALNGKRLDMRNRLVIRNLVLGKKTDSPHAADMPLPTAVAALRDNNGVISLDLPVSGTIGDPRFKISGIVGQMIGNVMVKTVTTPFTLIGSLVTGVADLFTGGSGPREARIVFAQGRSSLDDAAKSSLKHVGKSLQKHSSARLTLTGTADMAEKDGLIDSWVESRLREMKYQRLSAAQKQKTSPEKITVGPGYDAQEYADLLFALYNSLSFVKNSKNPEITSPQSTRAVLRNIRAHHPATEKELLLLADARAKAVLTALVNGNPGVAARIRILPSKIADSAKTEDRLESFVHIEAVR